MAEKTFEQAMEELEAVVDKLEKGEQPLDESLKLFERGVKLARYLRDELGKAESKIEILLKDEKGELESEPFESPGEGDSSAGSEEEKDPQGGDDLPF